MPTLRGILRGARDFFFGYKKKFLDSLANAFSIFSTGRSSIGYYESWVFAAVNKIAKAFAVVNWRLYKMDSSGDIQEVEEHPVLTLLYKFNPRFTRFDSLELTAIYYLLNGKSPWLLMGEGKSTDEIWVLNPEYLSVKTVDAQGWPTSYTYSTGQSQMTIPATNILDIRNPDPAKQTDGKSTLDAVRTVADMDKSARDWNKTLMDRHAQPSAVVEVPEKLDADEAKLLRKMLEESYSGAENAHAIAVLTNGAKLTPYSMTPAEVDFKGGRENARDEILAIFNVPKILLGMEGQYNRATAEAAEAVFSKYAVQPLLQKVTEQLNEFLLPRYGAGYWLEFDSVVPADREAKVNEYNLGWNKWLTTNEIREQEGLPSLTGGDMIYAPLINVPMIGAGGKITPSAEEGKTAVMRMERKGVKPSMSAIRKHDMACKIKARDFKVREFAKGIADGIVQKMDGKKITIKCDHPECDHAKKKFKVADDAKLKWWNETMEYKRKLDGSWKAKLMGIFAEQERIIKAKLDAVGSDYFKAEGKATDKAKELLFDIDNQVKATITVIKPEYYNSMLAGAELAAGYIGEKPIDILAIPEVKDWLDYVAKKYGESITQTTYDDLYRIFQTAFAEGQSTNQVAETVAGYFDDIAPYRADMIARTESARAMTASQGYTWDAYGFENVEWYAEPTACEICVGLSQDEWTVEDAKVGTVNYSHPNCECRFLPK
jgi:HK97 family phage portal protein